MSKCVTHKFTYLGPTAIDPRDAEIAAWRTVTDYARGHGTEGSGPGDLQALIEGQRAEIAALRHALDQSNVRVRHSRLALLCKEAADYRTEIAVLRARKIAIIGGCECGIGYIDPPDSIDSGATFRCDAGHPIVFDVASPQARAALFLELRAEIVALKAELSRL